MERPQIFPHAISFRKNCVCVSLRVEGGGWWWGGGEGMAIERKREREREDRSERRYQKSKGSSMVQDQLRFFRIFVGVEWSKRPMEELLGIPKSNLMAGGCVGFGVSLC